MERMRNTFRYMTLLMLASVMFLSFFGNFEEINDHYRFAFGGDRTESSASAEAVIQSGDLAMLSASSPLCRRDGKSSKADLAAAFFLLYTWRPAPAMTLCGSPVFQRRPSLLKTVI